MSRPRLTLTGFNTLLLIMEAYNLRSFQVDAPPGLLPYNYYDISAVAPWGSPK